MRNEDWNPRLHLHWSGTLDIQQGLLGDNWLPRGSKRTETGAAHPDMQITPMPHTGCKKFAARFGVDALKFISSPEGKRLHMRGIYAKVVQSGAIQVGDQLQKI